jgi:hypothetical protein
VANAKETLAEIARLGRQSRHRLNDFSDSAPCRWQPHTVENPETGLPFTDASAWEFICDRLEAYPEQFVETKLEKPAGQIGYVTVVTLEPTNVLVYIKVQLVQGRARGRSFHISTKGVADV